KLKFDYYEALVLGIKKPDFYKPNPILQSWISSAKSQSVNSPILLPEMNDVSNYEDYSTLGCCRGQSHSLIRFLTNRLLLRVLFIYFISADEDVERAGLAKRTKFRNLGFEDCHYARLLTISVSL
ncbi:hypothetical protein CDAR_93111, partial [Caerostris darwini]